MSDAHNHVRVEACTESDCTPAGASGQSLARAAHAVLCFRHTCKCMDACGRNAASTQWANTHPRPLALSSLYLCERCFPEEDHLSSECSQGRTMIWQPVCTPWLAAWVQSDNHTLHHQRSGYSGREVCATTRSLTALRAQTPTARHADVHHLCTASSATRRSFIHSQAGDACSGTLDEIANFVQGCPWEIYKPWGKGSETRYASGW